jgi:amidase
MAADDSDQQLAADNRVHGFGDDALGEHDAVGLAGEIRAGRISRREAVEAAIARTQKLDTDLRGLACERFADALAESATTHEGFFAGVPSFVKDNSDVAGLPTQQGTRAFVAEPAKADGDFARMFSLVGATVLGKTRLSEYGFSPSAEFRFEEPVRNPWHTGHTSGASSAGSAAFVAAGAVPISHANDGGGSIRIPAACCGLVGLKPTRGRTPSDKGHREMPVRIVYDGVVTRSVRDTAAFLRESERAYRDLELPPIGDVTGPGNKRLRVAVVMDSMGGRVTDKDTRAAVQSTADLLEDLGHTVVETALPEVGNFEEDFLLYWSSLALYLTRTGKLTFNRSYDRSRNDNFSLGLAAYAARNAWRLPAVIARLQRSHRITGQLYASHDLVLTPVLSLTTPEIGWLDPQQPYETVIGRILDWIAFTPIQNATGDPAISLPMGSSSAGLPIGVQIAAPRGYDRRLVEVAYELEQARPFARIQD